MIQRIRLHNFMSHADSVIELAEGLTVLVGPNNSGKSAVVEALRILCTNDLSKYAVRHGERECSVVVETNDGHRVEWRRDGAAVSYVIDGEEFDRLGRKVPDELHRVLRLPSVEAEGNIFDLHFGDQKAPIFLLDRPPSHAAQFFASSSDANKLVEMQGLHRQKTAVARSERRRLEASLVGNRLRRGQLGDVPQLSERVDDLEERAEELRVAGKAVESLGGIRRDLERAARRRAGLQSEVKVLAPLVAPPKMKDVGPLTALTGRIRTVSCQADRARSVAQAISPALAPPPELKDPEALAGVADGMRRARSELVACRAASGAVAALAPPPALQDEAALRRMADGLAAASARQARLAGEALLLAELPEPPDEPDFAGLAGAVDALGRATEGLEAAQLAVEELGAARVKVEADARRWAETQEVCPTCGTELDPDAIVGTALAGHGVHSHE